MKISKSKKWLQMPNIGSFENPKTVPTAFPQLFTFVLIQNIEETMNPITVKDGEVLCRDGRAFKHQTSYSEPIAVKMLFSSRRPKSDVQS